MTTLVLTMIGNDRSGLVDALSGAVVAHGGSWHRSHMAHLAGKFAGIVVVEVPDQSADALIAGLAPLREQGLLDVTAEVAEGSGEAADAGDSGDAGTARQISLHLVGQDRPGIVHEVSRALARSDVSIQELETSTHSAPMSAEHLFEANAVLSAPADVSLDGLREALEELANELMVDIDLDATT